MKYALSLMVLLVACRVPSGLDAIDGRTDELVKTTHSVQADDEGVVEFAVPGFSPGFGLPLVQTYEVTTKKFASILLLLAPHTIDALGVVRMGTDPNTWVVIVVVQHAAGPENDL